MEVGKKSRFSKKVLILLIFVVIAVSAIAILILTNPTLIAGISIKDWSYEQDASGNFEFEVFVKNDGGAAQNVVVYGRVRTSEGEYTNSRTITLEPGETERVWFQVYNVPHGELDKIKGVDCYLQFP